MDVDLRTNAGVCSSSEPIVVPPICIDDSGMPTHGWIRRVLFVNSSTISAACGRRDGVRCQHVFSNVSLPMSNITNINNDGKSE